MIQMTHHTQGPEDMCLLEYQNPSKTSEKMGYFNRITVSLHILTKTLRARKIALQYIKYGKGGNKFGADFRIFETQMKFNEIS